MTRAARKTAVPRALAAAVGVLSTLPAGAVAAVVGQPGSGKTRIMQAAAQSWDRSIVIDPYAELDRRVEARSGGVYPWPGEPWTAREILEDPGALDRRRYQMVVAVPADPELAAPHARAALEGAWHTGDLVVVCEEASLYSRAANAILHRVTSGGRHVGLRVVLASQSWSRLSADVRRHVSHLLAYRQSYPDDLRELARGWGREVSDKVRALELGAAPVIVTPEGEG